MKQHIKIFFKFLFLIVCMISSSARAEISCSEYTKLHEYSSLEKIIPYDLPEEEKCKLIPDGCGYSWLFFNPDGEETFYFKSECYYDIAIKRLDLNYCDLVIERKSLFLDGSYYSPDACREKINTMKSDIAAKKVDPKDIHSIKGIKTVIDGKTLKVDVSLSDAMVSGYYALSVYAQYKDGYSDVSASLNPDGTDIRIVYDRKKFQRFLPVNNWFLYLDENKKSFSFTSNIQNAVRALKKGEKVEFTIEIQFIQTDNGEIADMEKRDSYASHSKVYLKL